MVMHEPERKMFFARILAVCFALFLVSALAWVWFVQPQRAVDSLDGINSGRLISWQEAGKHYGEYVTVEGKVVASYRSAKVCFLNFHADYKRNFTVVIFASNFPLFPDNPEKYYLHKTVRVSGQIKEYKGKPEIILNEPAQIKVIK